MGYCKEGPALVTYPQSIWYKYSNQKDIDEIIAYFIIGDSMIKHLAIKE